MIRLLLPRLLRRRHLRRCGELRRRFQVGLPHVTARHFPSRPTSTHRPASTSPGSGFRNASWTASTSGRAKASAGGTSRHQMQKYKYPAPGYPEDPDVLSKYGGAFIGTMNETNRYVKMYRTEGLEFVVNQSIWFEGEVPVRRHHPARLHQLRALGHQRVRQLLRIHPRHLHPVQPPGHLAAEEVHRTPRRVQIGLRDLRDDRREARHRADVHRGQGRAGLGGAVLQRHRHAQAHDLRRVQGEGLLRRSRTTRSARRRRPCDGSPRTARKTRPTGDRA